MVNKEDNSYHLQYDDGDEEKDMNEGKLYMHMNLFPDYIYAGVCVE
jgi:hypothetical protein